MRLKLRPAMTVPAHAAWRWFLPQGRLDKAAAAALYLCNISFT